MKRYRIARNLLMAALITVCAAAGFASAFASSASTSTLTRASLPENFVKWQAEQASETSSKTAKTSVSESGTQNYGYIPSPITWPARSASSTARTAKAAADLPVSYDIRPSMPAIRDQNPFGNCWTYSAMAATESNLITKKLASSSDINLAEWYLTYYAFNNESSSRPAYSGTIDNGGNDWISCALLARGTGSIDDSKAPAPLSEDLVYAPTVTARQWKLANLLYLGMPDNVFEVQLTLSRQAMIKEALMKHGALSVGIYYPNKADRSEVIGDGQSMYSGPDHKVVTNHAVTIVGWDDNYPATKFTITPKSGDVPVDGAWIIRNSWGDYTSSDKGHFYVSYLEPTLCDGVAYDTQAAPSYDKVYQYDMLGLCGFMAYDPFGLRGAASGGDNTLYFANMFPAEADENITSVSLYVAADDETVKIKIYTGCGDSPVSGTLAAAQEVSFTEPGYHTITLDSGAAVRKGTRFSVVAEASSATTAYLAPLQYKIYQYTERSVAEAGHGFISADGKTFADIKTTGEECGYLGANICLKAFAESASFPDEGGSSGGCSSAGAASLAFLALLVPAAALIRRKR